MGSARPAAALLGAAAVLSAGSCLLSTQPDPVPTVVVEPEPFQIRIPAFGELQAAQATPIQVPPALAGVQRLAWLAPEGQLVHEGEPVARLDGDEIADRIEEGHEALATLEKELAAKQADLARERASLEGQLELLHEEQAKAEQFAPRDEELFSRHEILDAEMDLELIRTKIEHCRTRLEQLDERSGTELEILRLRRQTEEVRLEQSAEAQAKLEIRAPHDGFFLYGRTWQDEKMRPGMTIWPGVRIGELPDVSRMEAKLHVLESEAAGLAEGLAATVEIDAHPGREWTGKISSVEPVANPIDRESPVKYFQVVVALDETDTEVMSPGSSVQGSIFVSRRDETLSVPNQAIFHEGDATWVWIANGHGFERRPIAIGERSVSRTIVTDGLARGDRIALADPRSDT